MLQSTDMVRMRTTKGRRNKRRGGQGGVGTPSCSKEGGISRLRHHASRITGIYKGRKVIDVSKKEKDTQADAQTDEKKTVENVEAPK